MKHFYISKEYDGYINVLKNHSDWNYINILKCKLCEFRPDIIWNEAKEEIDKEMQIRKFDYEKGPDIELITRGYKYIVEKINKVYKKKMKPLEKCKMRPTVIKTKDIEFVDFLVSNDYKISNVIPIGRQKEISSSSSDVQTYKGIFRFAQRARSSSFLFITN